MAPAIEMKGVTKIFKERHGRTVTALNQVTVSVGRGEIFALLGPNGAGKTTLLKILASLMIPDSGQVRIFGQDLAKNEDRVKPWISFTQSEERSFYWRLTGRQNLEFFAALYGLNSREARRRIAHVAKVFGIEDLEKPYQEYSTGTKNRLALARSLLVEARLLLMDEPTRSLDPAAAAHWRALIRKSTAEHGLTVLFTSHNTTEVEGLADRMAILCDGKVAACGSLQELRSQAGLEGAGLEEIFMALSGSERIDAIT